MHRIYLKFYNVDMEGILFPFNKKMRAKFMLRVKNGKKFV